MESHTFINQFILESELNLSTFERIVLIIICLNGGIEDFFYCSNNKIAQLCGMSVDSLKRTIILLKEKNLIISETQIGKKSSYKINPTWFTQHYVDENKPNLVHTAPGAHSTRLSKNNSAPYIDNNNIYNIYNNNILNNNKTKLDNKILGSNIIVVRKKNRKVKKSSTKNERKKIFPEGFTPTEHHANLCIKYSLELQDEFDHFREHHVARGNRFLNWAMAFNTWLRNAAKFRKNYRPQEIRNGKQFTATDDGYTAKQRQRLDYQEMVKRKLQESGATHTGFENPYLHQLSLPTKIPGDISVGRIIDDSSDDLAKPN